MAGAQKQVGAIREPTLAVVITTFRRPEALAKLLGSLATSSRLPDEVIIVNNDPARRLAIASAHSFPVNVIDAGLGLNLAGGRNVGARATVSDACVFVDDDNGVSYGTLAVIADVLRDSSIAFVAPVILAGDTGRVWCGGVRRSQWTTRTTLLFHGKTEKELPSEARWETEDMPDCFAVRRNVLVQMGGFDEVAFPFHYDEADFGWRFRALGLSAYVLRAAQVCHYGFSANDVPGAEMLAAFERHGGTRVRVMVRARVYFHRRHGAGLRRASALVFGVPAWVLLTSIAVVRLERRPLVLARIYRAMAHGMFQGYRDRLVAPPRAWEDTDQT